MALYKKSEFAGLCGVSMAHVSVNIKRGKIIVENDLIDDRQERNKDFLAKCVEKKDKKPVKNGKTKKVVPVEGEKVVVAAQLDDSNSDVEHKEPQESLLYELDKDRKSLDIEIKREDLEIKRIEKRKKLGELMPVELVKTLVTTHTESIKTAYSESADKLIVIFSHENQLSDAQIAKIRGEFTRILNAAIDLAVDSSKKTMRTLIQEFSNKRGVGQHG